MRASDPLPPCPVGCLLWGGNAPANFDYTNSGCGRPPFRGDQRHWRLGDLAAPSPVAWNQSQRVITQQVRHGAPNRNSPSASPG